MNYYIFLLALAANLFLLTMMAADHFKQNFQFWPPLNKTSWQYKSLWWTMRINFICVVILSFLEWSTLAIPEWLRFFVAFPVFFISFTLGTIAFLELGWRNTHGKAEKFVESGLYRYSRNPQYIFYVISFIILAIVVASTKVIVLLSLISFWYLKAPFLEEKWLEKQYGEEYLSYKKRVPVSLAGIDYRNL